MAGDGCGAPGPWEVTANWKHAEEEFITKREERKEQYYSEDR